jgi:hypothetical protein
MNLLKGRGISVSRIRPPVGVYAENTFEKHTLSLK